MQKEPTPKDQKLSASAKEEQTLAFWRAQDVFQRSLYENEKRDAFVFYDGPPFATGLPHHGHLLQGTIKDVIPRYQTMKGRTVRRVWGWDCHGLPVENLIEGELGLKHKKDIEAYGIQNFNEKARASVLRYDKEWKEVVPRMGRWIDMEHPYRTMDPEYTESVWWAFKTLYDKGLIYEGYKPMHLCPRCETTLSNFEVAQGYKDVKDISVYVKFAVEGEENTYFLAWTTTPWTLPGNVALAVGKDIEYVFLRAEGATYILAESRLSAIFKDHPYEVLRKVKGESLVGKSYTPVFDDYAKKSDLKNRERGWKVYAGDFVTTEDGTGIVHIAPAFGEDDMKLGEKEKLPFIQHVKMDGTVLPDVKVLAGMEVKPKGEDKVRLATDIAVLKYLQDSGTFFAKENITHSYPHCWRCDTPLLNYAATSWFVKVTAIKDDLIRENKKVLWVPEHIRDGRFGNWLENARDWAISRTRYWGAPLPVWRCESCKDISVIGSLSELRANTKERNTYTLMRHGEAESNAHNIISGKKTDPHHLTEKGKKQVQASAKELKGGKAIDVIYASPFLRTKETAHIVAETLGFDPNNIIFDDRLSEINAGEFDCGPIENYRAYFSSLEEKFEKRPEKGENLSDVRKRVMGFIDEIDKKHEGKHILVVTHEYDIWMLHSGAGGLSVQESVKEKEQRGEDFLPTAGTEVFHYTPIPHNDSWELDMHRPYIDQAILHCACGGPMRRIPEVFDCWFESGSMPFAQFHYLGNDTTEAGVRFLKNFPADFIAEAVDQTRGWFYNMLVLSVGLFGKSAFKSVICTGLIMAEDGQKMSKKLKNYPDPMEVIHKYGADTLRLYMLSSPVVRGENLNFSMAGIDELYKKILLRTKNVCTFFELYRDKVDEKGSISPQVLDQWILSRLSELEASISSGLERFELDAAVRGIPQFVDDLSTWYVRRSRERLKGEDEEDAVYAATTLRQSLHVFARLIAPIMPFFAEEIFSLVRGKHDPESVHLSSWPKDIPYISETITHMERLRSIVTLALDTRVKLGIKVRQPLQSLSIPEQLPDAYLEILREEVNVKEVVTDASSGVTLDAHITPALRHEGQLRDLTRAIQELRKKHSLNPQDVITLTFGARDEEGQVFLSSLPEDWKKTVHAKDVSLKKGEHGEQIAVDTFTLDVGLM
jgi:isoleucyl-tRNA synthetase